MSDYMPGAVQVPQPGGVTLDTSLPPRFVWHITWDQLRPDGSQPDFSAVAGYLQSKQYCPHIMWNPFTGYMEQYYPASVGSRALAYNDQDGAACIQVEVFFTPGCVVDGVKYATVADTPLKGWADLLAWGDSLGVPRVWPLGSPQWQDNSRDAGVWNTQAGHYGHCNSPGDTHTDPGPMPPLTLEDPMPTLDEIWNYPITIDGKTFPAADVLRYANINAARAVTLADTARSEATNAKVAARDAPAATLNQQFKLPDGTVTNLSGILAAIHAQPVTGGAAAVVDPQAIADAVAVTLAAKLGK